VRLAVPPRHEEFQARGDEEPTRALADNVRKGSYLAVPLTSGGGLLSGVKLKKHDQELTLGSKVGLL
jgi:hypothetical protein